MVVKLCLVVAKNYNLLKRKFLEIFKKIGNILEFLPLPHHMIWYPNSWLVLCSWLFVITKGTLTTINKETNFSLCVSKPHKVSLKS